MLDELAVLFVFFLDAKVTKVCVVKVEPLEVYVSDEVLTSVLEADAVEAANVSLVTLGVHQISWVVTSPFLLWCTMVHPSLWLCFQWWFQRSQLKRLQKMIL